MGSKEIKELRKSGKLEEALDLAKTELQADPENIWSKRNISWVYYEYLKKSVASDDIREFCYWLDETVALELDKTETLFFDQLSWQVGKILFVAFKKMPFDIQSVLKILRTIQVFTFSAPSEGYSFLFKAFHKCLKDSQYYLEFADWWNIENFSDGDFKKEKMPNGKEIMALAEQGYIAYSKQLLPKQDMFGNVTFSQEKVLNFLPLLSNVIETYPQLQYPPYFKAKLLLAMENRSEMLYSLLPFAKKKANDFWVWELIAEAFPNEPENVFSCYCKALTCNSPEEMLIGLREKIAAILISKGKYNEAKTEIELLLKSRKNKGYKTPKQVESWIKQNWYQSAKAEKNNFGLYKSNTDLANAILFSDIPEEMIFVEFVNSDKKILNFIISETKFGFFKYAKHIKKAKVGDVLKVRFKGGENEGMHQIHTAEKVIDATFKEQFMKEVEGTVRIIEGKSFGFIENIYIHPSIVSAKKLSDGEQIKSLAIKSYNKGKKQWGWKLV